jgi:uncharacterized membrane protein
VNKAAVGGIIAAIIISIVIVIAVTQPFDIMTQEPETVSTSSEEPKEFKVELKEEIGLQGKP